MFTKYDMCVTQESVQLQKFQRGVWVHDASGAAGREDESSSRVVQRLQQSGCDTDIPRRTGNL